MGTPAATLPARAVLDAFGASGEPISLQGGQGRPALWSEAVLIGDTVTWSDARQALDARATLGEDADQYLLRGLLFRLAAHLLRTEGDFTSLPRFEAAARQLWPAWL